MIAGVVLHLLDERSADLAQHGGRRDGQTTRLTQPDVDPARLLQARDVEVEVEVDAIHRLDL